VVEDGPPGAGAKPAKDGAKEADGEHPADAAAKEPTGEEVPPPFAGLKVLILADSMGVCGFGKRLDHVFRQTPGVVAVHTYMASGTNPLSWLKAKPYTTIKTFSGYWSIESVKGASEPKVLNDTYGMTRGHKPGGHLVPKIEDLLATLRPDILVFQNGDNFFSCFGDKRTIREDYHTKVIRGCVDPFVAAVAAADTGLKKFYWVTPPQVGCASEEIQEFVYQRIRERAEPLAVMVDSRKVTSYPYSAMGHDKEHFWGPEADKWADDVFGLILGDLRAQPFAKLATVHELAKDTPPPAAAGQTPAQASLKVRARLVKTTPVPKPESFSPYQEFLVGYRYQVEKVLEGTLDDRELLVMHPAYIRLKRQDLAKYEVGRSYDLSLRTLDESSLWGGVRSRDDTDSMELLPFIPAQDESRHPGAAQTQTSKNQAPKSKS